MRICAGCNSSERIGLRVVLNNSVCYAEMGGQVGDTGEIEGEGQMLENRWHAEGG